MLILICKVAYTVVPVRSVPPPIRSEGSKNDLAVSAVNEKQEWGNKEAARKFW
jgi:hypothetical protein